MRRALIQLVRGYQWFSKYRPPTCRYWPTCSEYAVQAIDKHGPIRGMVMAAWRILRCNPWSPGGFDPVN
ncbi:MAG TPA: membrane protein insertion efficiency factor YidD [Armatimonadota bacterium]|nr:membrane protein insertion efficiency factor YidD [Armatimonadota bacterium]